MIPGAAVEAAARAHFERSTGLSWCDEPAHMKRAALGDMRAALEAAYPILLSHEREETRLAHVDAVVNAETVGKLQAKLDAIERYIDPTGWHGGEQPRWFGPIQIILNR